VEIQLTQWQKSKLGGYTLKDSAKMASRLLSAFADLHNEFLLGDIEGAWIKEYV